MSWQTYVDSNLIGTGKIARAAIVGQQGGVWASSPGYNLSEAEQRAAVNAFKDQAATQASGVRLAGNKFFTLQIDDTKIYGKKGQSGCTLVKTNQAILVCEYDPPTLAGEANVIVEKLGDYLRSVSY